MEKRRFYLSVRSKFLIAAVVTVIYSILCTIIEIPWWTMLSREFGKVLATLIVVGLAFLPGIMICMLICGIILDKPRRRTINYDELPDLTVLIAAHNEETRIYDTLMSLAAQGYPKSLHVKVIDNNSTDNTKAEIFRAINDYPVLDVEYMFESTPGKFAALNTGLAATDTEYVITLDADTFVYRNSLEKLAYAMVQENRNKKVGAIAGTVLVRNSRVNLLTKMQEWEYFLALAGIKRMQGLFQSVLVAQGAFSIYQTALLKELGGWQDSIGEDIVLTWQILSKGYKTYYEDCAIGFTDVPTTFRQFFKQRSRWARGMIEGFRHFSFKSDASLYSKLFIFLDYFLIMIDFSVLLFFIPGLIAAVFFHKYMIVGPMTALLLPITVLLFLIMLMIERTNVFKTLGLKIRKHYFSVFAFMLTYSLILAPASALGFVQELFKMKKVWK